ncbi:MAG: hypothetical protein AB7E45_05720 [Candidatus Caldatribacteriota bacterium]
MREIIELIEIIEEANSDKNNSNKTVYDVEERLKRVKGEGDGE